MVHALLIRSYAGLMLVVLLSVLSGQQYHIYTEDPLHFAGFCQSGPEGDDADGQIVASHKIDNFCFFPYFGEVFASPLFRSEVLAVLYPAATSCKLAVAMRGASLRAPPAA